VFEISHHLVDPLAAEQAQQPLLQALARLHAIAMHVDADQPPQPGGDGI
jgi:hypothetical protein